MTKPKEYTKTLPPDRKKIDAFVAEVRKKHPDNDLALIENPTAENADKGEKIEVLVRVGSPTPKI